LHSDDPVGSPGAPVDQPVLFDTRSLRLRKHGITLEYRRTAESSSWRLVLPRGETLDVAASASDDDPPERITALLRGVTGDELLRPSPWQSDSADLERLQRQVGAQRRAMLRHDPGTRLGVDPENLHQFRVANRRLRAYLRAARRAVDAEWAERV